MNYGGGLVAGDDVAIECAVGTGCTVAMTTQVHPPKKTNSRGQNAKASAQLI